MSEHFSSYLSKAQCKAIVRLGNLMLPRNQEFPSFGELGCIEHIDEVVTYLPQSDLNDLKMLLSVLAIKPRFALKLLIKLMSHPDKWPVELASVLRQMDTGLRGIVMSLYYSGRKGQQYQGETPLELMGVKIERVPLK